MKMTIITCGLCCLLTSVAAQATTLVTGTPANAGMATPTAASPNLGGIKINFDSLTPGATFASTFTTQGVTFTSPDGLEVLPFSTQTGPNELFDTSLGGSANLDITLGQGTDAFGVGIADSDPVTIMIQALGLGNTLLGSAFSVTIPENTNNPGNGYFVVEDKTNDIFGLQITETASDPINFSGLAIDDVQVAPTPEPSSFVLMATGLFGILALGSARMLKRA
jgi:PEP-CTERM motif